MVEEHIVNGEVIEVATKVDNDTGKVVHIKVDSEGNELAEVAGTDIGIGQINNPVAPGAKTATA